MAGVQCKQNLTVAKYCLTENDSLCQNSFICQKLHRLPKLSDLYQIDFFFNIVPVNEVIYHITALVSHVIYPLRIFMSYTRVR